jgi:hypothetical protein
MPKRVKGKLKIKKKISLLIRRGRGHSKKKINKIKKKWGVSKIAE